MEVSSKTSDKATCTIMLCLDQTCTNWHKAMSNVRVDMYHTDLRCVNARNIYDDHVCFVVK